MSADANSIEAKDLIFIGASCCCFGALYKEFPGCIGCSGHEECLCLEADVCCKMDKLGNPYPINCKVCSDNLWCQLSCPCLQYTCKPPAVLCKGKGQFCCCVQQAALPCTEDVPCMCGTCFISCYPTFGVCKTVGDIKSAAK